MANRGGDYRTGIRWNICVPDATDMLWVLKEIDRATEAASAGGIEPAKVKPLY